MTDTLPAIPLVCFFARKEQDMDEYKPFDQQRKELDDMIVMLDEGQGKAAATAYEKWVWRWEQRVVDVGGGYVGHQPRRRRRRRQR